MQNPAPIKTAKFQYKNAHKIVGLGEIQCAQNINAADLGATLKFWRLE